MLKEKIKKIVYLSLVIIWMIVVFSFSNENGNTSQNTSRTVTKTIIKTFTREHEIEEERIESKDCLIRKCAHFSIYTLGGILIYNYINTLKLKENKKIIVSIILGILYAASDEMHQYFVAGRSAQVLDVCIDSMGIILGVIINYLTKNGGILYERKDRRNE